MYRDYDSVSDESKDSNLDDLYQNREIKEELDERVAQIIA